MSAALRWALFGYGLILAIAIVYLSLFAPQRIGSRTTRVFATALALAAICLAVGAAYRHPVGWLAGLLLTAFSVLEPVVRLPLPPAGVRRSVQLVWIGVNFVLLILLTSSSGRHVFGIGAR